jgi:hypothetical protein
VEIMGGGTNRAVWEEAARAIWNRERATNCAFTLDSLLDEIKNGSNRSSTQRKNARKVFELLLCCAPNEQSCNAWKKDLVIYRIALG